MPELDHVGIAVPSLADALAQWRPLLGGPDPTPEEVPSNRVRVVFLTVGGTHIELLEPSGPDSPVARFLVSRGPGVHHIAFHVPSVERALQEVAGRGGELVDRTARPGARGRRVGFARPSAFGGVLVEFVEGP
ncbi:MAG: methylmalonyl-CoA epimerase [Thermoplasmata archaeon]|nr:methylmalonyl-CoA epimerase [Thermoplasmata archaeon]